MLTNPIVSVTEVDQKRVKRGIEHINQQKQSPIEDWAKRRLVGYFKTPPNQASLAKMLVYVLYDNLATNQSQAEKQLERYLKERGLLRDQATDLGFYVASDSSPAALLAAWKQAAEAF